MDSSFAHLAFVYGTLKRGENNYDYWLAEPNEAMYVGEARTLHRYPFFINLSPTYPSCSPCVLDQPDATEGCQQVEGELFLITAKMRAWLDVLEDIKGGTYSTKEIPVERMGKGRPEWEALLAPYRASNTTLTATIYFKAKNYSSEWAEGKDCTAMLSNFRASQILAQYGKRFTGGCAHRRPGVAEAMQRELNALPESLRPPTSQESVDSDGEYYGAPLRPKPIVLFIIDGVGDNTYPELGHRTPLEVVAGVPPREIPHPKQSTPSLWAEAEAYNKAHGGDSLQSQYTAFYNPAISAITRKGVSGLLDPYEAGRSCGSDTAHLSLFGYPPTEYYRGRGAYEALGAGLSLGEGDIAFKSNFCTQLEGLKEEVSEAMVYNHMNFFEKHSSQSPEAVLKEVRAQWSGEGESSAYITFRRCDRDFTKEGPVLSEYLHHTVLDTDVDGHPLPFIHTIEVQYATEHRCGLSITEGTPNDAFPSDPTTLYAEYLDLHGELSDHVTGTDPLKDERYLLRCQPKPNPEGKKAPKEMKAAAYTSVVVEAASALITRLLTDHPINNARREHNRALYKKEGRGGGKDATGGGGYKNIANTILFRGAAKKGFVPDFSVRHGQLASIIAPTCIIRGLGACCGMLPYRFPSTPPDPSATDVEYTVKGVATGDFHSDPTVKWEALEDILLASSGHHTSKTSPHWRTNFIVLHMKGVDDAGHDRNGFQKLYYLSHKCAPLLERLLPSSSSSGSPSPLPEGSVCAVLADHSTPLFIGDHCCEPVPLSACLLHPSPPSVLVDGEQDYTEHLEGTLGRCRGEEVIPLLKRLRSFYHYPQE